MTRAAPASHALNPSGAGRRTRYAAQSAVLALAVTACCVFAVVLADRFPARFDLTATREHELSPRTRSILAPLPGPFEIVVAVNASGVDPRAAQRTQDVLEAFTLASDKLKITVLDAASSKGIADLDATMLRLTQRFDADIERTRKVLETTRAESTSIAQSLTALSEQLVGAAAVVKDADPNAAAFRKFFTDSGAFGRLSAKELLDARDLAATQAKSNIGSTPVPGVDEAAKTLRKPLANLATQLPNIADGINALAGSKAQSVPDEVKSRAQAISAALPGLRDRVARLVAAIDDLPRLPIAAIARTLERSSAAIVVGPPGAPRSGVTGIDVASLFPPKPAPGLNQTTLDTRAKTEELISSALSALSTATTPIVVIMHGETTRFAPDFAPIADLVERLRQRGVDVLEWPAAMDAEPPSTAALNPDGKRPVVFVNVCVFAGNQESTTRMTKLGAALRKAVQAGHAVMLSVDPSPLPGVGQPDPMVSFLTDLGLSADSGRPLMQQFAQPTGRIVSPDLFFTDPKADHPIARAIRGLTTRLPWPIPLANIAPTGSKPGATTTPVLTTDNANKTIWAESEWLEYRRIAPAERPSIANPPAPDSSRDDTAGPWTLIAAVERGLTSAGGPPTSQRLLVVGSNGWFLDAVAQDSTVVQGRTVLFNPGNAELFDAGLAWLAGQDDAIAASPRAQTQALIPILSESAMSAIRWGLIGGLPLLVLLTGAIWRLVRG